MSEAAVGVLRGACGVWGEKAILSFSDQGATVHLGEGHDLDAFSSLYLHSDAFSSLYLHSDAFSSLYLHSDAFPSLYLHSWCLF